MGSQARVRHPLRLPEVHGGDARHYGVGPRGQGVKHLGTVFLAIGSGLGVWVITHLDSTGIIDILIVLTIIIIGATLKTWSEEDR